MKLPASMTEINATWIQHILSIHQPGVIVDDVEHLAVVHGSATKVRVGITYRNGTQGSLPPSVMVKIGLEPHSEWVAGMEVYDVEANSYGHVLPQFDFGAPKCYYQEIQQDPSQVAIVLEDLTLRGAEFGDAQRPYTVEQVISGVQALANIHAGTWNAPGIATKWLKPVLTWGEIIPLGGWVEDPDRLLAEPRGFAVPVALHNRAKIKEKFHDYCRSVLEGPQCVLHGDAHVGNSFIADGKVNFFDWQCSAIGHWSHDIGYFMLSALDVPDRRDHEERILRAYLEELQRLGIEPPTFAEAMAAYKRCMIFCFVMWLGNPVSCQPEQVNLACFARAGSAIIDHGGFDDVLP